MTTKEKSENIQALKNRVLQGEVVTRSEALILYQAPLEELCTAANEIRAHYCGTQFDLCTIVNGKSGQCSENCKFCAQSSHYHTCVEEYPLLSITELVNQAKHNHEQGIARYSIVTSGKRLSEKEVEQMCLAVKKIKEDVGISVCVSFGLLQEAQYRALKLAGVSRVHNNLETSRRNFPNICTTHTFEDKIAAIKAAQAAGLTVCSGGIMGLQEETPEDRIDMALVLRELCIKSIPVNVLNPIPGTPFEDNQPLTKDEVRRIIAVYRFILPDAFIRMAGGRGLLGDKGASCFLSGANAAISGDMLTTAGITVETDLQLIKELGYEGGLK
ncbi:MAG: biotin synthase BioB [Lachnospiraceae bacterium]